MRRCAKSSCSRETVIAVEHALLRRQIHHAREAPVLGLLRGAQVVVLALEDGGRIGHRGIEPALVERVPEVVVVRDVAARAAARVVVEAMPEPAQRRDRARAHVQARERVGVRRRERQQGGEVRRVPVAVDVGGAEPDRPAEDEARGHARADDDDLGVGAGPRTGDAIGAPVRRADDEASRVDARGEAEKDPQAARQALRRPRNARVQRVHALTPAPGG
jgi:hypothetical protein